MTREEKFNDYEGFVEKFKPKKTTDDCYTPPAVYEAVKAWACRRYGIDPACTVRPFWPGGDYEHFDYPAGAVVLDNPPFSCLAKIVQFYQARQIPFFLFAPGLTALGLTRHGAGVVYADSRITYHNGAQVNTCFVTSYGDNAVEIVPDLGDAIKAAQQKGRTIKRTVYQYPAQPAHHTGGACPGPQRRALCAAPAGGSVHPRPGRHAGREKGGLRRRAADLRRSRRPQSGRRAGLFHPRHCRQSLGTVRP